MRHALSLAVACAFALPARAAPISFNHSGYLLDGQDAPVQSSGLPIVFSLWDDASATGAQHLVWTSGACTVPVLHGYYAIELGTGCADGLDSAQLAPDLQRWLEVTIDSARLTPRLSLEPVPAATIARRALSADTLGTETAANFHDASRLTGIAPASVVGDAVFGVTADAPITATRAAGQVALTIPAADPSTDGVLLSHDFLTFSSKLDVIAHDATLTGTGRGDAPLKVQFGTGPTAPVRGDDGRLFDSRTPSGSAGGDLGGTFPGPAVVGLQGRPLAVTAPATNQVLQWNGTTWTPGDVAAPTTTPPGLARKTGAALSTFFTSAAITIGATGETSAVLSGDATASLVKNGLDTGARLATFQPGDTLAIRMKSATTYDTQAGAAVVYGGAAAAWIISTGLDDDPDPFDFTDVPSAGSNVDVTSNVVTLASFAVPLTATVSGDSTAVLLKNGSASGASVTVTAGDQLAVRVRSASANNGIVSLTIAVGARTDGWKVTTITSRKSCLAWLQAGFTTSGTFLIDPDGAGGNPAFTAYCDQQSDGGGWTLAVGITNTYHHPQTAAVGTLTGPGQAARLSDTVINQIKDGTNPAFRLQCGSGVGFWPATCTLASTSDASGACVTMASTWNSGSYVGTTQQGSHLGVADGNRGFSDRLIFGRTDIDQCDNNNGWGSNGQGALWVR